VENMLTFVENGKTRCTDSVQVLAAALDRGAVAHLAGMTFTSSWQLVRALMRGVRCLKLHGSETGTAPVLETLSWAGEEPPVRFL
jgi:hypothetical protein